MEKNIVSIIIATYNRAHLLGEMLDSVLNQTYSNWECLIIDDGSSDNTEEIVHLYIEKDERFRYLNRSDSHLKGLPGARNYGLECAQGKYIIFFDDDDVAHPEALKICTFELDKRDEDFCRYLRSTFTGDLVKEWDISYDYEVTKLNIDNLEEVVTGKIPFNSCQIMWRIECFDNSRFNEFLMYAEEWELYTRLLSRELRGVSVQKVLYFGRKHPASNTGEFWEGDKKRRESNVEAIKLVIENLQNKNLLSPHLIRHFIQMSIFLKNKAILEFIFAKSNMNNVEKIKYKLLYKFYPILVLGHRTKRLLKN